MKKEKTTQTILSFLQYQQISKFHKQINKLRHLLQGRAHQEVLELLGVVELAAPQLIVVGIITLDT